MSQRYDLLRFLLEKNIPIWEAIEILEQEEEKFKNKIKAKEKAIIKNYEKR